MKTSFKLLPSKPEVQPRIFPPHHTIPYGKYRNTIINKYTLRFCLNPNHINHPDIYRTVKIASSSNNNVYDEYSYRPVPLPRVVRTAATQALDNTSQLDNIAVPVGVKVLTQEAISEVKLYYKNNGLQSYQSVIISQTAQDAEGTTFEGTIPASVVKNQMVSYYFEVLLTNGNRIVTSPGVNSQYFAWTIRSASQLASGHQQCEICKCSEAM